MRTKMMVTEVGPEDSFYDHQDLIEGALNKIVEGNIEETWYDDEGETWYSVEIWNKNMSGKEDWVYFHQVKLEKVL